MQINSEYCLMAEGDYESVDEAKRALAAPFWKSFEKTGKFRYDDFDLIQLSRNQPWAIWNCRD